MQQLLSLLRPSDAPTHVVDGFYLGSDMPGRLLHICFWATGALKHGFGGCAGYPQIKPYLRAFIITVPELFLPRSAFQYHARSRCTVATVACTLLFLSFLFRTCIRRPGCFRGPWSTWHLQVASWHLKPWNSLSASFIRIFFNPSLRASVAGGGSRRRIEAPCTTHIIRAAAVACCS